MKSQLKRAIQAGVSRVAPWAWRQRRASLLILTYHRVLPSEHPDRASEQAGMFVSPQTLAMHLEVLKQHFTLVHLDEWLAAGAAGHSSPCNACALTFDDGWRDNFDHAWPVLRAARAPATIFLVSDLVGTRYTFWPNTLARLLAAPMSDDSAKLPDWLRDMRMARMPSGEPLAPVDIDTLIMECKARHTDAEMHAALSGLNAGGSSDPRDLMSWEEIHELHSSGLVRFGSHTRRHTRLLDSLSPGALEDEILGSRTEISRRLGAEPLTFCYPNGDISSAALECVRRAYRGAVTTRSGWNGREADAWRLNRVGVHEDVASTRAAFLSRLAGIG